MPSEETLRPRLDEFKPSATYQALNAANIQLLKQQKLSAITEGGLKWSPYRCQ